MSFLDCIFMKSILNKSNFFPSPPFPTCKKKKYLFERTNLRMHKERHKN